jgi:HPt (histidine-containing phosphotransfer) domain-containing protein
MESGVKTKKVLDISDLMERLDDDHSLAVELAQLFISDVAIKRRALKDAIDRGKYFDVEREAHALKGAAANLSAEKVCYLAGIIETAGRDGDMNTAIEANAILYPAVDELISALTSRVIDCNR